MTVSATGAKAGVPNGSAPHTGHPQSELMAVDTETSSVPSNQALQRLPQKGGEIQLWGQQRKGNERVENGRRKRRKEEKRSGGSLHVCPQFTFIFSSWFSTCATSSCLCFSRSLSMDASYVCCKFLIWSLMSLFSKVISTSVFWWGANKNKTRSSGVRKHCQSHAPGHPFVFSHRGSCRATGAASPGPWWRRDWGPPWWWRGLLPCSRAGRGRPHNTPQLLPIPPATA